MHFRRLQSQSMSNLSKQAHGLNHVGGTVILPLTMETHLNNMANEMEAVVIHGDQGPCSNTGSFTTLAYLR